jgi:hypothetical protein
MSDGDGSGRAVFVFDADASYALVRDIRQAGAMPTVGLRYVAAVTGRWKIFKVMSFQGLGEVADRLDAPGDPETATTFAAAQVRRSHYRDHTVLVRIETSVADPSELLPAIREVIGDGPSGEPEADVVAGAFDILACVVDDDESEVRRKIMALRDIDGVTRTESLHVIDYVSTSDHATGHHRVEPAAG